MALLAVTDLTKDFGGLRAVSRFTFDVGISTLGRSTRTALRIRVNMSAIGSVIMWFLNLQFVCRTNFTRPWRRG